MLKSYNIVTFHSVCVLGPHLWRLLRTKRFWKRGWNVPMHLCVMVGFLVSFVFLTETSFIRKFEWLLDLFKTRNHHAGALHTLCVPSNDLAPHPNHKCTERGTEKVQWGAWSSPFSSWAPTSASWNLVGVLFWNVLLTNYFLLRCAWSLGCRRFPTMWHSVMAFVHLLTLRQRTLQWINL